jgi:hypothetical protein
MRKAFGLLSLVMLVALSCSASISQGKNDQEVDPTAIRRDQSITTFLPVQDIEYCKGGEIPLLLDSIFQRNQCWQSYAGGYCDPWRSMDQRQQESDFY